MSTSGGGFNYNQLTNVIGRDASAINNIQNVLLKELESLKTKVSTSGTQFKAVVNTAEEVWAGTDKDQFIQNVTSSAEEFTAALDTLIANIKKYLPQDVADFNALQTATAKMTTKVTTK